MRRFWSIRFFLLALQLAIAVPLIGLLAYSTYSDFQDDSRQAGASSLDLAQANAANIQQLILDSQVILARLAQRPLVRALDPAQCDPLLTEFHDLHPQYANIAIYGANGQIICSALPAPTDVDVSIGDTQWFQTVARTNAFVVGSPFVGRISGKWVAPLVYPVLDARGQFIGTVNLSLDLEKLQSVWAGVNLPQGSAITIVDNNGVVVARSMDSTQWIGKSASGTEIVDTALSNSQGALQTTAMDGINRYYAFTTIPAAGWHISVGVPSDVVLADARARLVNNTGLILGFILLTGVLGFLAARAIEQPFHRLEETVKAIGEGNWATTAQVEGSKETAALATEFNTMVSALARADAAVRNSEARFRALIENSWDGLTLVDAQNRILYSAPSNERIFGYKPEERTGRYANEFIHPDDAETALARRRHVAMTPGAVVTSEYRIRHKSGAWVWTETIAHNMLAEPHVQAIIINSRDITERKRAEAAVAESQAQLAGMIDTAMDAIITTDADHRVVRFNPAAEKVFGYSTVEVLGQSLDRFIPARFRETHRELVRRFGETNETARRKGELPSLIALRADGSEFPMEATISQVEVAGKKFFTVILRDITARKRTEDALHKSEEQFRLLIEQASDGIFIANPEGRYIAVNPSGCKLLGYTTEEILQLTIRDVTKFSPENPLKLKEIQEGESVLTEREMIRKDGTLVPVEISGKQLPDGLLQGIVRDITERKRAQEALQESENRFRTFVEHTSEWILMTDEQGTLVEWNPGAEEITGLARQEVVGRPVWDVQYQLVSNGHKSPAMYGRLKATFAEAFSTGISPMLNRVFETQFRRDDGIMRIAEQRLFEIKTAKGIRLSGISRDVTEREHALAQLRFQASLLHQVLSGIVASDAQNRITYWNRFAEALYGWSAAEVIGQDVFDVIMPRQNSRLKTEIHPAVVEQGEWEGEVVVQRKNGSTFPAYMVYGLLRDEKDRPFGFVLGSSDITEQKQAAEALRESQAKYRDLVENLNDVIFSTDANGVVTYISPVMESLSGYKTSQVVGRRFTDFVHPDDLPELVTSYRHVLAGQGAPSIYRVRKATGEFAWVRSSSRAVSVNGELVGISGVMTDITERKRAEDALRESEARLATIFRASPVSITISRLADGQIIDANDAFLNTTGYTRGEVVGHRTHKFGFWVNTEERDRLVTLLRAQGTVKDFERQLRTKAGTVRDMLTSAELIRFDGESYLLSVNQDITERKRAEQARREAELHYRSLFQQTHDAVFILNLQGQHLDSNQRATEMLGYTPEEMLALSYRDLSAELPESEQVMEQLLRGEYVPPYERLFRKKNGERVPVEINVELVRDDSGCPSHIQSLVREITERKRAEKEILRRAEEFAALYEMTHDLSAQYELPALLQTIAANAVKLLKSNSAAMYMYDSASDELELTVKTGFPFPIGARLKMGEGMAGRVAQSREPLMVDDYQTWESRSPLYEGTPFRAVAEVPMLYGGNLIGVLAVTELGESLRKYSDADLRLLSLFASTAASAVYNTRLLEETRTRAEQLALLYDAGLTLNLVLDSRQQLEFLCKIAMKALHADNTGFFRYDATQNDLYLEFGVGFVQEMDVLRAERFPLSTERGLIGWVAQNRVPFNLSDVTTDPRWIATDSTMRSALWVPVVHGEQLLGVLSASSTRVNAFTSQDERLFVLFANQVAVAMENARLFNETRHRLAELEAVNRISTALRAAQTLDEMLPRLLDETLAILDTSAGALSLFDPSRGELEQLIARGWFTQTPQRTSADDGIAGRVLATGQPYVTREFKPDPATSDLAREQIPNAWGGALVPIRATNEIVGTLAVSVPLPRELTTGEVHLLTTLAEIAGNAIHRTRLHAQTEQRLQQLQSLHAIDTAIASSFDLPLTLRVLLEQAAGQLKVDAAEVMLLDNFNQALVPAVQYGFRHARVEGARVRVGEGIAGCAALERTMKQVPDLEQDQEKHARPQFLAAEGFVSYYSAPLIAKGLVKGVLNVFHRRRFQTDSEWLSFLEALADQTAIAIDNAELYQNLQRSNIELRLAYDTTLEGWSRALDLRDKETEGHTQRVTEITQRLARALGMSDEALVEVRRGGLLHDIGKMGVPDNILLKEGTLTAEDWVHMRKHPVYAYELLAPIAYLHNALDIPYCHHEKWDGTGYPRGLRGEAIPFAARIFAVVDVWDALRSDRPYRKAWTEEDAREQIRSLSGSHFDPRVVGAFLQMIDEL